MSRMETVKQQFGRIWEGTKAKFTDYIAYQALEGAVLGIFDGFTPEQVYHAIEQHREALAKQQAPPDLWGSAWAQYEQFRLQFQLLARDPRYAKYLRLLDMENVLTWLSGEDARPQLASVIINTPGGIQWLDWEVRHIRAGITAPLEEPQK